MSAEESKRALITGITGQDGSYLTELLLASRAIAALNWTPKIQTPELAQLDWTPQKIDYQLDKPVGVASRSSDNSKIFARYEWKPKVSLSEGVKRTLDWYVCKDDKPKTVDELEQKLMAR
jgi:GDP-D-mannose dehydratase